MENSGLTKKTDWLLTEVFFVLACSLLQSGIIVQGPPPPPPTYTFAARHRYLVGTYVPYSLVPDPEPPSGPCFYFCDEFASTLFNSTNNTDEQEDRAVDFYLSFNGRALSDSATLHACSIKEHSTLEIDCRMRGGTGGNTARKRLREMREDASSAHGTAASDAGHSA
jgi:hypothetical protein